MSLWFWVLVACALAYALKLVGYLVPDRVLDDPRVGRMAGTVTVGLLAALVVMNAFGSGQALVLDARLGALLVAGVALWLRAPFLLVVALGAVTAAVLRLLGAA
ncbi:MAG TPA: AzlD domain-containing protein [Kocuria rosea]|nr:AzlD domain-containing protein [Kocuria rosea]